MKYYIRTIICLIIIISIHSCKNNTTTESKNYTLKEKSNMNAEDILGNPNYLAMSYGGYRHADHDIEPTQDELKEDIKLLSAMGIKILRTYKVHKPQASNLLKAISELKKEIPNFEMYVMLGAWIDCLHAWTDQEPNHNVESERNAIEIATTVKLANQYPDIVKVIAVGNEAMVKWATSYYVQPGIILKWVDYLQKMKKADMLPKDLWITSSDNFASWGGGHDEYHVEDLNKLIATVDYLSVHTYPMHDTHYNPVFWNIGEDEQVLTEIEKIDAAMIRAKEYAISQYNSVKEYMQSLEIDKPVHIGETGWASNSNKLYVPDGSRATDEYKEGVYYKHMREWTKTENISCFYFEGFDEQWKDSENPQGSENHFGLINLKSQAKFAIWDLVDQGIFEGLTRDGKPISKTYNGDKEMLMKKVQTPIIK